MNEIDNKELNQQMNENLLKKQQKTINLKNQENMLTPTESQLEIFFYKNIRKQNEENC